MKIGTETISIIIRSIELIINSSYLSLNAQRDQIKENQIATIILETEGAIVFDLYDQVC